MKKAVLLFGMLLMAAPAHADLTHKISSSVQLSVDAAATNVQRIGNSYSVSGSGCKAQRSELSPDVDVLY